MNKSLKIVKKDPNKVLNMLKKYSNWTLIT